ncbi:hypothetical protein ACPTBI_005407, partial [Escherichia coli]
MKIIETPFSKITATVVVELRSSATKVKSMAIFCHRQIFNGFPLPVFYSSHYRSPSVKGCCNACSYSVTTAPSGNFIPANTGQ